MQQFELGAVVVTGRADLVFRVVELQPRAELEALYLRKEFATRATLDSLDGYRLASERDQAQARRYAAWFNEEEGAEPYWLHPDWRDFEPVELDGRQALLPLQPNPPRQPEQLAFPFPAKFSPSPAGEGEPGSSVPRRAKRARVQGEPRSGGQSPPEGPPEASEGVRRGVRGGRSAPAGAGAEPRLRLKWKFLEPELYRELCRGQRRGKR